MMKSMKEFQENVEKIVRKYVSLDRVCATIDNQETLSDSKKEIKELQAKRESIQDRQREILECYELLVGESIYNHENYRKIYAELNPETSESL